MSASTLVDWNRLFRSKEAFPHVNAVCAMGRKPEPALFDLFSRRKDLSLGFASANIDMWTLTGIAKLASDKVVHRSASDSDTAWSNGVAS